VPFELINLRMIEFADDRIYELLNWRIIPLL